MVDFHATELPYQRYAASAHTSLRPSDMTLTLTSLSVFPVCLPLMSLTACPYDRVPDIKGHLRVTQMCVYMLRCVFATSTSCMCCVSIQIALSTTRDLPVTDTRSHVSPPHTHSSHPAAHAAEQGHAARLSHSRHMHITYPMPPV